MVTTYAHEFDIRTQVDSPITIEVDGIAVRKAVGITDDGLVVVALSISSDRNRAATLSVSEELPSTFSGDEIGFHSSYEDDCWMVDDLTQVQFERIVEPGESFITLYGVNEFDLDDPANLVIEPTIEVEDLDDSEPFPDGGQHAGDESDMGSESMQDHSPRDSSTQEAESVFQRTFEIAGQSESDEIEGLNTEAVAEEHATQQIEQPEATSELDTGHDPDGAGDASPFGDIDAIDEDTHDASAVTADAAEASDLDPITESNGRNGEFDSIAEQLIEELQGSELPEDFVELVQRATDEHHTESEQVQLSYLHDQVAELTAYTDALEEFIDEHGTADSVLTEVTDQIERTQERLDRLERETDNVASAFDEIDTMLEHLSDRNEFCWGAIEAVNDELDEATAGLEEDIETMATDLTETNDGLEDLGETVDTLSDELDDFQEELTTMTETVDSLQYQIDTERDARHASVSSVEEAIEQVTENVERIATDLDELASDHQHECEDLRSDIEQIEAEVEQGRAWRNQVSEAFPVGAAENAGADSTELD